MERKKGKEVEKSERKLLKSRKVGRLCRERKIFERKEIIARLLVFYLLYNFLDRDNQLMARGADTGTLCNPLGRLGRVAYISLI